MQVSKKAQYGIRAMIYLARNSSKDKVCSLKEISKKEDIPFDFLEKIMAELEKAGLVKAKKGAHGGYFLFKKANKIKAGDIIRTLENVVPVGCMGCPKAMGCSSKVLWDEVQGSLDSALDSNTLADLIK